MIQIKTQLPAALQLLKRCSNYIRRSLFDDLFGERFVIEFKSCQGENRRALKGRSRQCAHLAKRFIWSSFNIDIE